MALFKPKKRNGNETPRYYLDFYDHTKTRRRVKALKSKTLSVEYGRNIEALVECRLSGHTPDSKLCQWLETLPSDLLKTFASWGLIDGSRNETIKPLELHITDYLRVLESKGYTRHYLTETKYKLTNIMADCRFFYFRDIQKSAVELYLGRLKKEGYSGATRGHYLGALKAFLSWALDDQKILSNPIAGIETPARDSERKGVLTAEQFIHLIRNTFEKNIIIENRRGDTTGQDRAALYLTAGFTGLRKNELLSLLWSDIHLGDDAFINIRKAVAKSRKEARQPLPPIAISLLGALHSHTKAAPGDRVFAAFSKWINTAELIRQDLEAADLPLIDREQNKICFHSLRNSYISFLADSQTPPKIVQKLARHSDPKLTFNLYARTFEKSEQKALAALPDFGAKRFDYKFDQTTQKPLIQVADFGQTLSNQSPKTAFLNQKGNWPRATHPRPTTWLRSSK